MVTKKLSHRESFFVFENEIIVLHEVEPRLQRVGDP